MLREQDEPVRSLYVHVPFCVRKCSYCAFFSEPTEAALGERYVAALLRELESVTPRLRAETIFFGGGTPTLLSTRQWDRITEAIHKLNSADVREWSIEANPATLSLEKARLLRGWGINRVSMGVQSFDDPTLARLGRIHTRREALRSFDILRRSGFENVGIDLMFAIPGQTLDTWRKTLSEAVALESEHLSCYELTYEEDTPFFEQLRSGQIVQDEDLACAMYEELLEKANSAAFRQYEVANFATDRVPRTGSAGARKTRRRIALPDHACRHNVNYWRGASFYGLGPSATSYVGGVRTKNVSNTRLYCERIETGKSPVETSEHLPPLARAGETAAFGLRMVQGWNFEEFLQRTGHDLRKEWAVEIDETVGKGWAVRSGSRFRLNSTGLRFADSAAQLFLRS